MPIDSNAAVMKMRRKTAKAAAVEDEGRKVYFAEIDKMGRGEKTAALRNA